MTIKHLSLFLLLATTRIAVAAGQLRDCAWHLNTETHEASCTTVSPALKVPLNVTSGSAKILSWKPAPRGKDLWVLEYVDLHVGTSVLYNVEHASVVNVKTGVIQVDAVTKYVPVTKGAPPMTAPKWNWGKDKEDLKIIDTANDENFTVELH